MMKLCQIWRMGFTFYLMQGTIYTLRWVFVDSATYGRHQASSDVGGFGHQILAQA
jgi:hypothetical protein